LLRDFLSFDIDRPLVPPDLIELKSAVMFALSAPGIILDGGTWAIERRERGRTAGAESRDGIIMSDENVKRIDKLSIHTRNNGYS
jgi:hypothetical protein